MAFGVLSINQSGGLVTLPALIRINGATVAEKPQSTGKFS
jgi:hypothetical protein